MKPREGRVNPSFSDWDSYVDPIMGSCFTFNKDSRLKASRAGPIYGLRLVLKTNVSEFMATSATTGMRVVVHDQKEFPFPDVFGHNIQAGRSTEMRVSYVGLRTIMIQAELSHSSKKAVISEHPTRNART